MFAAKSVRILKRSIVSDMERVMALVLFHFISGAKKRGSVILL